MTTWSHESVGVAARMLGVRFKVSAPLGVATALVIAVAFGAGCTFLVSFNDAATGDCDGGLCVDATTPDAGPGIDGDVPNDAAAADVPDVEYAPCKGLSSGVYCADDHIKSYRGPLSDLITCDAGAILKVRACGDAGCIAMKDPFPDTCNECPTKPAGTYCGRDFAGFPAANSDILISCQLGNVVQNFLCPHGCKSNGTMAACYP